MRRLTKTILGGVAVAGAAVLAMGAATPASAGDGAAHTLLLQLLNGQVEQIEYIGPVAPRVTVAAMDQDPVFAAFQQMAALMDQQAAAMLQQVAQMPAGAMPNLPPGVSSYSVVTAVEGGHACTRSTEVRYDGRGLQPQTVSHLSGDCGALPEERTTPAELPAPAEPAPTPPQTIRVKYSAPKLNHALVHEAFYQHASTRTN